MWYSRNSRFFIAFCLLLATVICRAQYHPQYSQYMLNGLAINPAYAGRQEVLSLALLHRNSQWGNSVEGAPVTQTFSGDFPLRNPQLALGMLVYNDQISIYRQTGAYFDYAFRIKAGEGKLSFGLQAGFDLQREDLSKITIIDQGDTYFDGKIYNTFMPNVGTGAYYYTSKFFIGLSFPHLLTYFPKNGGLYQPKLGIPHTMLQSGFVIPTALNFSLKPSTLLQYTQTGLLVDLNCNVGFLEDKLELGASWRNENTLVAMAQFRFNSFCIGYAYDYAIGKPSAINTSHEIILRFDFKITVKAVNPLQFN
jgi:type IX secretion system PorP/SprF family membrane protein